MASPDDTNNNSDLQQGSYLRSRKAALVNQDPVNLALLEQTTGPSLGSIVEGLDDPNSAFLVLCLEPGPHQWVLHNHLLRLHTSPHHRHTNPRLLML